MKTMRSVKLERPESVPEIPESYKTKERKRRSDSDPTLMAMSVAAGVGMGFIGLVITGQI